jgi:hypothetical protein
LTPGGKARLAAEVLGSYVLARIALRRGDLPTALDGLRGAPPPPQPTEIDRQTEVEALRLGRVVSRELSLVPGRSRCLAQSLVLTRLLARRGLGSSLVIGVRQGTSFGAHAWVELAGRPLLPPGGEAFERLVSL